MDVLFLALGTTRLRAVIDEATQVVASDGRAVLLTGQVAPWRRNGLPKSVRVVDLSAAQPARIPGRVGWLLLLRLPRALCWLLARGPLARWAARAERAYEHRLAARTARGFPFGSRPVGSRPVGGDAGTDAGPADAGAGTDDASWSRVWWDVRRLLIRAILLKGATFDLMVISDPTSIPVAGALVGRCGRPLARVVAYQLDTGLAAIAPSGRRADSGQKTARTYGTFEAPRETANEVISTTA